MNKITQILVSTIVFCSSIGPGFALTAGMAGTQVAIRFLDDVDTSELANAKALAIQVICDVYQGQQKIFSQGFAGYVNIDKVSKGGILGKGTKIQITRRPLTDINGQSR